MVILSGGAYEGKWVDATVSAIRMDAFADTVSAPSDRYNIFVEKTTLYQNAVGFSGKPAYNIRRKHLRKLYDEAEGGLRSNVGTGTRTNIGDASRSFERESRTVL